MNEMVLEETGSESYLAKHALHLNQLFMVVDNLDILRFNVSMYDASKIMKVRCSHQLTGEASDVWESEAPPLGPHINLACVRPQIHMQEERC